MTSEFTLFGQIHHAPPLEPALYIVSTPIGNMTDITIRALQTLAASSLIAAEDTRTSRKLATHYGIKTPMIASHEHNYAAQMGRIAQEIEKGNAVALISDAGTPLISDPGSQIAEHSVQKGLKVISIPGPSAPIAALTSSGLPANPFTFLGFPPAKQNARKALLAELKVRNENLIFFESPKRIKKTLAEMAEIFGKDRYAVVAREITKKFETFYRGSLGDLIESFADLSVKGEIVIILAPADQSEGNFDPAEIDRLLTEHLLNEGVSKAAARVAKTTGIARRDLYDRAVILKKSQNNDR